MDGRGAGQLLHGVVDKVGHIKKLIRKIYVARSIDRIYQLT